MRRTLLVVHPGALGDVLLALPAMRSLRTGYRDHRLGLMASAEVGRLLRASGEVERVFPLETGALGDLMAGMKAVARELCEWLSSCALAVCWLSDEDGQLRSGLRRSGVERVLVTSPGSSGIRAIHQADRFLETVRDLAPTGQDHRRLLLPGAAGDQARTLLAVRGVSDALPLIALHPGSGSRHKCGDPGLFASVIEWCRANNLHPMLVGGPADHGAVASVQRAYGHPVMIVQGLDLLTIAGVLARVSLFVGHDSGLTHLAAALHRPAVALFGPTDIRRWAPRGSHMTILSGAPCRCEGWDAVQRCRDKPCLGIPSETLILACRRVLLMCGQRGSPASSGSSGRLVRCSELC